MARIPCGELRLNMNLAIAGAAVLGAMLAYGLSNKGNYKDRINVLFLKSAMLCDY